MVRVISQETFDSVVKENIEEFDQTPEEAIQEAIQQFKSQGVDLSNIVTTTLSNDHVISKTIQRLKSGEGNVAELCDVLASECSKGLAEKVLATKEGAYEALVEAGGRLPGDDSVGLEAVVRALASLLNGNPDPLDESGFAFIKGALDHSSTNLNDALVNATLELILFCCVRHEQNRQNLLGQGLLDSLDQFCTKHPIEVARVWQALVQDDDVRVPFGKAHENARLIVEEHNALETLNKSIKETWKDHQDLCLLLSCLSSLCVRNEYCQFIVDSGALTTVFKLLMNPDQKKEIVKECLKLLKVLSGNDNVKKEVAASGGIVTIINVVLSHMSSPWVCQAGCGAIAALCLRTPENCKQVMEGGGAQMITQVLKTHMDNHKVATSASSSIRNIVSRSRNYCQEFIELDIENLLKGILSKHPKTEDSVKAALRDLGLQVNLKEEWTGVDTIKISD